MLKSALEQLKILAKGTQKPQYNTSNSAPKTENKENFLSIERDQIPNTPFTVIGTKKEGYWLVMGKHRLSKIYKTKKEVIKHVKEPDWTLITSVMIAMIHDRGMIDKAYTKDTSIHPEEKAMNVAN